MSDRVGVAIVGLGWWGRELARAARVAALEVVSCYARTREAREEFAEEIDCRPASSLEDVLSDPSVEGVLVATSHATHRDMIEAAAKAGRHVFVEKPLALTVEDARASVAAAESAGVVLQVGFQRRRHPAHREIKRLIEDGAIGDIEMLQANHSLPGGFNLPDTAWRWDEAQSPLGSMTSLGIHQIENFLYLGGPITRVGAVSRRGRSVSIDEATAIVFEFAGGAVGTLLSSFFTPWDIALAVHGTEGAAFADRDGARLCFQARGQTEPTEVGLTEVDAVAEQLVEFARCVRGNGAPEVSGREGFAVAAVLDAAKRSVQSGSLETVERE
jgi:predicted dehydrogenase